MPLDRVAFRQRDVVAALHHPRTTALSEQALHGDRHVQRGIRRMRVQRGEEPGAAGTEDQQVGTQATHHVRRPPLAHSCGFARVAASSLDAGLGVIV
jgi:hypothetical protein